MRTQGHSEWLSVRVGKIELLYQPAALLSCWLPAAGLQLLFMLGHVRWVCCVRMQRPLPLTHFLSAPAPSPRSGKEAEVAQLRQMLEGFQQKVHALEVQNYSLALHLKQATDGKDAMAAGGFNKNPDVF